MFGYKKKYMQLVLENASQKDVIHNLNLYLFWLQTNFPETYEKMNKYFEGMAGYTGMPVLEPNDIAPDFVIKDEV